MPVTFKAAEFLTVREDLQKITGYVDPLEGQLLKEQHITQLAAGGHERDEVEFRYPEEKTLVSADLLHGIFNHGTNERLTMENVCRHPWIDDRTEFQITLKMPWHQILHRTRSQVILAVLVEYITTEMIALSQSIVAILRKPTASTPCCCLMAGSTIYVGQKFLVQ